MRITPIQLRRLAALAACAIASAGTAAPLLATGVVSISPGLLNYASGPQQLSDTPGPYASDQGGQLTTIQIKGSVVSVTDPAGVFSAVSAGSPVSGSLSLDYPALVANAYHQSTLSVCPGNPGAGPCDCGCYFPGTSGLNVLSSPGTYDPAHPPSSSYVAPSVCAPWSSAVTTPLNSAAATAGQPGGSSYYCVDYSLLQNYFEQLVPNTAQTFSLSFADGSRIEQAPNSSLFFVSSVQQGTSPTTIPPITMVAGPLSKDHWPNHPPDGAVSCTGAGRLCDALNGAVANGGLLYEVQWIFPKGSEEGGDLQPTVIAINYYRSGNDGSSGPDGTLTIDVSYQFQPGLADPGGPMVFENGWTQSGQYKANNVVTENGVTYLALNANSGVNPATDTAQSSWIPLGYTTQGTTTVVQSLTRNLTGTQGPAGPQGPAGADGLSVEIVGSANAASCPTGGVLVATMTSAGAQVGATSPLCNGAKGDTGAQGPAGTQGPQGPQGTPGIDGLPSGTVLYLLQGASMPSNWTPLGAIHEVAVKTGSGSTNFNVVVWLKN